LERERGFLAQFKQKKKSEIKLKDKVFSTESKEQHKNLKQTEIILYIRGVAPT